MHMPRDEWNRAHCARVGPAITIVLVLLYFVHVAIIV